jgi:segregation and condensation protein A
MAPRQQDVDRTLAKNKDKIPALGVVSPPPIHVETDVFQGSLATLFACVRDHKVDLMGIPLAPICEAYFAYMISAVEGDLDEAAAALSALAYLLERKAWLLLPVPDPEPEYEEPMEEIPPSSHEYRLAITALSIWQEDRDKIFFRSPDAGPDPYELPYSLANVTPEDLARAFERLLKRAIPDEIEPLNKRRKSLEEQMDIVLARVSSDWQTLEAMVEVPFTRTDVVYWFLALLELIRLGKVMARVNEDDVEFALATVRVGFEFNVEPERELVPA